MLILLVGFSLSIRTNAIGQKVQVKVFNKTGYKLDSMSFNDIYFGKIDKDSAILRTGIEEIIMLGDLPLHRPFAIIEGKSKPHNLAPCATKSRKKKAGFFSFDLFIYENENVYHLYWKKHNYFDKY
jgi:hypothetical protein